MGDTTSTLAISADFQEQVASEFLLQPDAEMVFAKWAHSAAIEASMEGGEGWDLTKSQIQNGRITVSDRPISNMEEAMSAGEGGSLLLSHGMMFPGLFKMVSQAKEPGDNIKIPRPIFVDGITTEAKRTLTQQGNMFGKSQSVTIGQVAVAIVETSGPGDTIDGTTTPIELPLFTQDRASHDMRNYVRLMLKRDRWRFQDDLIINRLIGAATAATGGITRPSGIVTNADYTVADNEPFEFNLTVDIEKALKDRSIPGLGGIARYIAVLTTKQVSDLKKDPVYREQAKYYPEYSSLFPGYVTHIGNFVVCESTRLPTLLGGAGGNVVLQQGIIMGPGVLGWALAKPAWVLRDNNDDGGRKSRWGWSCYEGYQTLDDRFVQLVITD